MVNKVMDNKVMVNKVMVNKVMVNKVIVNKVMVNKRVNKGLIYLEELQDLAQAILGGDPDHPDHRDLKQ